MGLFPTKLGQISVIAYRYMAQQHYDISFWPVTLQAFHIILFLDVFE